MAGFLTASAFKLGANAIKSGFNVLKQRREASKRGEAKKPIGQLLKEGYTWAKGQASKVATFKKTDSGGISIEPKAQGKKEKSLLLGDGPNVWPIVIGVGVLLLATKK